MRAQTMARRCFGRARNQHRGTQSSAVCPQIPHLPWDVGAHARKISMHFGFFPPRYPISSIVQYTRNMQSIKIPSTRHFENSKETHQSPGSRLLTPPAPSHPLHCCLVVSPQRHAITRLCGEILTQNNQHPRRNHHPEQFQNINRNIIHSLHCPTGTTNRACSSAVIS